jgi:hypothetical protein
MNNRFLFGHTWFLNINEVLSGSIQDDGSLLIILKNGDEFTIVGNVRGTLKRIQFPRFAWPFFSLLEFVEKQVKRFNHILRG